MTLKPSTLKNGNYEHPYKFPPLRQDVYYESKAFSNLVWTYLCIQYNHLIIFVL